MTSLFFAPPHLLQGDTWLHSQGIKVPDYPQVPRTAPFLYFQQPLPGSRFPSHLPASPFPPSLWDPPLFHLNMLGASSALAGPEGDEGGWECPCAEKAEDTPVHFSCWVQRAAAGLRGPCLGDAHCFWLVGCRNYQPHSTLRGLALCSNCLSPGDPPQRALGLMAAVRRVRAAAVRACGPHCSPFSVTARQV